MHHVSMMRRTRRNRLVLDAVVSFVNPGRLAVTCDVGNGENDR